MKLVLAFLVEHAPTLAIGSTVVLGAGALAVACSRAPLHRQRWAELAVAGSLLWLALAVVPLPRLHAPVGLPEAARPISLEPAKRSGRAASVPERGLPQQERRTPIVERSPVRPFAPPASTPAPESARPDVEASPPPWREPAAWAYLAGAVAWAGYLLLGWFLLRRVMRQSERPAPWLRRLVAELASEGGLGRSPRVFVTRRQGSPYCFGVLRPTIVLPASLCRSRDDALLRPVLAHEVAHLRQRDGLGHAVLAAALPFLWVHPLYWWLRARAHIAAELVADDLASRHSDRRSYARALIGVSERHGIRPALLVAAPVWRSPSEFYRRMNMLLQRDGRLSTECSRLRRCAQLVLVSCLVAGTAGVWGVQSLPAQGKNDSKAVREIRAERDRLAQEVLALHTELKELRALMAVVTRHDPHRTPPNPVDLAEPVEIVEVESEEVAELELAETPEEPVLVDEAAEEVAVTEVPLLADLPVLGNQFRRTEKSGPMPHAQANAAADGRYIVDLVTRAIDLRGDLEIARHKLERCAQLAEAKLTDSSELRLLEIGLETTERKYDAIRQMVEAEAQATALELSSLTDRAEGGKADKELEGSILRLQARYKLLRSTK